MVGKWGGKLRLGVRSIAFPLLLTRFFPTQSTLHATKAMKTKTKLLPFLITALKSAEKNSQFALITARKARQSLKRVVGFFIFFLFSFIYIYIFFSLMRRTLMKELQRRLHRNYGNMEIKKSEIILVLEGIVITPFSRLPLEFLVGWLDGWLLGKWKCIEACNGNSASEKSTHTAAAALYLWRAMRG